jgi:hypothetical protein
MPRSFDVSFESPATVDQVHSTFADEDYWLARIAAFDAGITLDSLTVDSDGAVTVNPHRVIGDISVAATGAPVSGRGTALLTSVENGSQMEFSATVEFRVPVVGGTIENYLAGQLAEGIADLQQFTTSWISEHA